MDITTEHLELTSDGKNFDCYVAAPKAPGKYPALILIEEIWGVDKHIKDLTERYAAEGFIVLSPELLGDTGILEKISPAIFAEMQDPGKALAAQARMREVMQPIHTPEYTAKALGMLDTCFHFLETNDRSTGAVGVLGFCFGGTYSFHLAVNEPRLKAAAVFYGQAPDPLDDVAKITCPVYAFHGEKDERLVKQLPDLTAAMEKYGKDFSLKVYPGAGHAFMNDTRPDAYNEAATKDAFALSTAFFKKHLS